MKDNFNTSANPNYLCLVQTRYFIVFEFFMDILDTIDVLQ